MTRLVRFTNNASSQLAANLSNIATSLSVTPGDGAKFPTLTGSQYFTATILKADGTKEVVKVTARSTDTFTIERAAEPVAGVQTAVSFTAGDRIELRMTAGSLGAELDRLNVAAFPHVLNKNANYTVLEADLNSLIRVDSSGGARTMTLPLISTLTDDFTISVAKVTSDGNAVNATASGSDTVNGAASLSLTSQYQSVILIADRANNVWTTINSGAGGSGNWVIDTFTGNGTASYTLSGSPGSKNNTTIFVGGVYQEKSTYTLSGTSLTLGGSVSSPTVVEVAWAAPLPIGTPADGTVSTAKLDAGVVNGLTTVTMDAAADYIALADGSDSGNAKKALLPTATDAIKGVVELATAAEAQAWASDLVVITAAKLAASMQGSNQSLGASGYQKFPGGLIIQWGGATFSTGGTVNNFPISFPTSCDAIVLGASGSTATPFWIPAKSNSGFTGTSSSGTAANFYLAIGR